MTGNTMSAAKTVELITIESDSEVEEARVSTTGTEVVQNVEQNVESTRKTVSGNATLPFLKTFFSRTVESTLANYFL